MSWRRPAARQDPRRRQRSSASDRRKLKFIYDPFGRHTARRTSPDGAMHRRIPRCTLHCLCQVASIATKFFRVGTQKDIRWTASAAFYRAILSTFSQGVAMNDVSRSFRGNSNAARDIAHHLHPYTNFKKHEQTGPLTIVRGRGIYVMDDDGKEYIEGMAGLWSAALGFSNERLATVAYEQMKQLPFYHAFNQRSHEPAINLAEKLKAMAPVRDVEGVLRQLRLRGQRHRRQDGVVHEQCARPAAEEEDRLAHQGLSRHHRGVGEPHRPAAQPPLVRPADRRHPAHELPALLPLRQGRRDRGAVRDALRRGTRAADHQGRRRRPGRGDDLPSR